MFGFLNVNKPAGKTSHDVVARVRKLLRVKQVGHAGTLDPAATGVLPIGVGSACRLFRFLPQGKTYLAEVLLGRVTSTDDTQGEVVRESPVVVSREAVIELLPQFTGEIDQIPPMVSAIHIDGERLYKLVREGRAPQEIPSRRVTINKLELLSCEPPLVRLRVDCSGGTYIRSIARDLGELLGCGGCLSSLVRERAGNFQLQDSIDLDCIDDVSTIEFVKPESAISLPVVHLDQSLTDKLRKGQKVEPENPPDTSFSSDDYVMAVLHGELVAICRYEAGMCKPEVVLNR
jgi:tRNA pseudouridine55 synthase